MHVEFLTFWVLDDDGVELENVGTFVDHSRNNHLVAKGLSVDLGRQRVSHLFKENGSASEIVNLTTVKIIMSKISNFSLEFMSNLT